MTAIHPRCTQLCLTDLKHLTYAPWVHRNSCQRALPPLLAHQPHPQVGYLDHTRNHSHHHPWHTPACGCGYARGKPPMLCVWGSTLASSEWIQLWLPISLAGQSISLGSVPTQNTSSNTVAVVRICSSPEEVNDFCVTTEEASTVELISKVVTIGREKQITKVLNCDMAYENDTCGRRYQILATYKVLCKN